MNEVEETVRVLNIQIEHIRKETEKLKEAFEQFKQSCKTVLDKATFTIICNMFKNCIKFYDQQFYDAIQTRDEILKKYDII